MITAASSSSSHALGRILIVRKDGSRGGSPFPITSTEVTFGRDLHCAIRVQLPGVQACHCKIVFEKQQGDPSGGSDAWVENCDQHGTTVVNGSVVLTGIGAKHRLSTGDVITVVERSFVFEYSRPSAPVATTTTVNETVNSNSAPVRNTVALGNSDDRSTTPTVSTAPSSESLLFSPRKTPASSAKKFKKLPEPVVAPDILSPRKHHKIPGATAVAKASTKWTAESLNEPRSEPISPTAGKHGKKWLVTSPARPSNSLFKSAASTTTNDKVCSSPKTAAIMRNLDSFAKTAKPRSKLATVCESADTAAAISLLPPHPITPVRRRHVRNPFLDGGEAGVASAQQSAAKLARLETLTDRKAASTSAPPEPLSPSVRSRVAAYTAAQKAQVATPDDKNNSSKKGVTFGPPLSPEIFDNKCPPAEPLRRGTPTKEIPANGGVNTSPLLPHSKSATLLKGLLKKNVDDLPRPQQQQSIDEQVPDYRGVRDMLNTPVKQPEMKLSGVKDMLKTPSAEEDWMQTTSDGFGMGDMMATPTVAAVTDVQRPAEPVDEFQLMSPRKSNLRRSLPEKLTQSTQPVQNSPAHALSFLVSPQKLQRRRQPLKSSVPKLDVVHENALPVGSPRTPAVDSATKQMMASEADKTPRKSSPAHDATALDKANTMSPLEESAAVYVEAVRQLFSEPDATPDVLYDGLAALMKTPLVAKLKSRLSTGPSGATGKSADLLNDAQVETLAGALAKVNEESANAVDAQLVGNLNFEVDNETGDDAEVDTAAGKSIDKVDAAPSNDNNDNEASDTITARVDEEAPGIEIAVEETTTVVNEEARCEVDNGTAELIVDQVVETVRVEESVYTEDKLVETVNGHNADIGEHEHEHEHEMPQLDSNEDAETAAEDQPAKRSTRQKGKVAAAADAEVKLPRSRRAGKENVDKVEAVTKPRRGRQKVNKETVEEETVAVDAAPQPTKRGRAKEPLKEAEPVVEKPTRRRATVKQADAVVVEKEEKKSGRAKKVAAVVVEEVAPVKRGRKAKPTLVAEDTPEIQPAAKVTKSKRKAAAITDEVVKAVPATRRRGRAAKTDVDSAETESKPAAKKRKTPAKTPAVATRSLRSRQV